MINLYVPIALKVIIERIRKIMSNKHLPQGQTQYIKAEIERVTVAIAKTKSPKLKRDYEKYLKKLNNKLKK